MILEDLSKWSVEKRREFLERIYEERIGAAPDFDNPTRFTEWIQWQKLYTNDPVMATCIDKITFKDYALDKLSENYTVPLIKVWNSPEDVSIDDVPKKCTIKSNCSDCGNNIIIVDENNPIRPEQLEEIKSLWFDEIRMPCNSFSNVYHRIVPRVLIEENIGDVIEYKFFCFNHKPEFLYVTSDHFVNYENTKVHPLSFYDMDWNYMDVTYGKQPSLPGLEKPECFDEMADMALRLSKDFKFVRVDFFLTQNRFYLAELTFDPGGGLTKYPESFDRHMMDLLRGE